MIALLSVSLHDKVLTISCHLSGRIGYLLQSKLKNQSHVLARYQPRIFPLLFEGGVAVMIDYHSFTTLYFTAGVVGSSDSFLLTNH
jgi:hypothetical protein